MRACIFIIALLFGLTQVKAQLIDGYQEEVDFDREATFGFNLNTLGGTLGGLDGRFAWKKKDGEWDALYLGLAYIKHSKEIRSQSISTGNLFTPGKINSFFVLRTQYGKEKRLFWKGNEDGVRLSWLYAAGPAIGFLKPYYIEYDFTIYKVIPGTREIDYENTIFETRREAYNPDVHTNLGRILGTGAFTDGFADIQTRYGISLKTGVNLEFGMFNRSVSGLETGFMLDYFFKEIRIFPDPVKAQKMFTSVYLSIYFGNRSKSKPRISESEE